MIKKKDVGKGLVVLTVGSVLGFGVQVYSANAATCRLGMTCPLPNKSCVEDSEEYTQVRQATDFNNRYITGKYSGLAVCGKKSVLDVHTSKCDKDAGGAGPAAITDRNCP